MNSTRPIIENIRIEELHTSGNYYFSYNEKTYYIPKVLSNEIITAQILNRRRGFRTAKAIKIIHPSPHRIAVTCPYYENCGGCNFLHIAYIEQLNLKKHIIQKAFAKYSVSSPPFEVKKVKHTFYYRNKATYRIQQKENKIICGFHPLWDNKNIVDIEHCLLLKQEINQLHLIIKKWLQENPSLAKSFFSYTIRASETNKLIVIFDSKGNYPIDDTLFNPLKKHVTGLYLKLPDSFKSIYESEFFYENIYNIPFKIHPLSFFQNHYECTLQIINFIKNHLPIVEKDVIYDLYSGNGLLSLTLPLTSSNIIVGIDSNLYSIANANDNASLVLKKQEYHFIVGDVLETFTEKLFKHYPVPSIVILDPPRSGTLIEIQKQIVQCKVRYIVYVSCNPVSLAWNLQQLQKDYKIVAINAFDMFPQTHQVETVVILKRIS